MAFSIQVPLKASLDGMHRTRTIFFWCIYVYIYIYVHASYPKSLKPTSMKNHQHISALYCQMIEDKATWLFSRPVTQLLHIFLWHWRIDVFALGFRLISASESLPLRIKLVPPHFCVLRLFLAPGALWIVMMFDLHIALYVLTSSCWSCPGGCLQVQPHLGIVP